MGLIEILRRVELRSDWQSDWKGRDVRSLDILWTSKAHS